MAAVGGAGAAGLGLYVHVHVGGKWGAANTLLQGCHGPRGGAGGPRGFGDWVLVEGHQAGRL